MTEAEHSGRKSAVTIIKSIKLKQTCFFYLWVHYLNQREVNCFHLINYHPLLSTAAVICGQIHNQAQRHFAN